MTEPIIKSKENFIGSMQGNMYCNADVDTTQQQTDSQPNKIPTTNVAIRVIKFAGKCLLCAFTVPIMAVLETLSGFVSGVADGFHILLEDDLTIRNVSKKRKICSLFKFVIILPPASILFGGIEAVGGLVLGIKKGVVIAGELSLKPLKDTLDSMKDSLSGKAMGKLRKQTREEIKEKAKEKA